MLKLLLIWFIRLYQATVSPFVFTVTGVHHCRFDPTCSEYTRQSIVRYGVWKGLRMGLKQLSQCHPFGKFKIQRAKFKM